MKQKIPQHVAIIMDGNGRWAEKQGFPRCDGHKAGVHVVKMIVKACVERQIPTLSLWAFGRENWGRPTSEVDFLMQLFLTSLKQEVHELHDNGISLRFTGDRESLAQALQDEMKAAETLTANNSKLCLNIIFNYSGKWDIVQAAKAMALRAQHHEISLEGITEQSFSELLAMSDLPDPDLFIRTSGEQRLSNFFLWQLAYTELYFTDLHWPDFTKVEFDKALAYFSTRERRYGKTSQQLAEAGEVSS